MQEILLRMIPHLSAKKHLEMNMALAPPLPKADNLSKS